MVSQEGIRPLPDNLEKVKAWAIPQDVTDICAIIGLGNYYRRFIKDYSKKVQPLVELTKKDVQFKWGKQEQEAFDTLRDALLGAGIVSHPQENGGTFILDTDASGTTVGCVLSQEQDGKEKVIAYGSKALSRQERNYCVTDRELLAVRYFIEYYQQYLLGRKFIVRTDHQAIRWLFSLKEPKDRIGHWLETLSRYQFLVEHHPGKKHGNADALSRRRCNPYECTCPLLDEDEELLQCGPCHKCKHRSQTMQSDMGPAEGDHSGTQPKVSQQASAMVSVMIQTEKSEPAIVPVTLQMNNVGISKSHRGNQSETRVFKWIVDYRLQEAVPSLGSLDVRDTSNSQVVDHSQSQSLVHMMLFVGEWLLQTNPSIQWIP